MIPVVIVYPVPLDSLEVWTLFKPFIERFAESLRQFDPGCEYRLALVLNRAHPAETPSEWMQELDIMFKGLPYSFLDYDGKGCDIGSFQHFAHQQTENVFMVCCVTRVFAWKAGWLQRMAEVREFCGQRLFATAVSKEGGKFHACTRCYAMDSDDFKQYPHKIESRDQGVFFEVGDGNLYEWFKEKHWPVSPVAVYCDLSISISEENKYGMDIPNIYRRGDQSQLLVKDKHSQAYDLADETEKRRLERMCFEGRE